MKALQLISYGKNLRQKVAIHDVPKPTFGSQDVQIRIKAASLNPVDYKMVYGNIRPVWNPPRPFSLGFDCAGIVEEIGSGVNDFKTGDEVYARVPMKRTGTFAEMIATPAEVVALKPESMRFEEAACLPLVGCTVMQSFAYAPIRQGQKILIHAGSGGVGSFAVQYASMLGAEVYTTTSTPNVSWVKELGAHRVIDYKQEDYRKIVPALDTVFDTLGGSYIRHAIDLIKPGGSILSIAGPKDKDSLKTAGLNSFLSSIMDIQASLIRRKLRHKSGLYKYVLMVPDQAQLLQIREWVNQGHIKAVIDRKFPLEQAADALLYLEKGRAKGKVVLVME